jgi:hypothetical protein
MTILKKSSICRMSQINFNFRNGLIKVLSTCSINLSMILEDFVAKGNNALVYEIKMCFQSPLELDQRHLYLVVML